MSAEILSTDRPLCAHCGKHWATESRGLCRTCYNYRPTRALYATERAPRHAGPCKHCGLRKGSKGRGLCAACFANPAIRYEYPVLCGDHRQRVENTVTLYQPLKPGEAYPDTTRAAKCVHKIPEDCCPQCEKLQRAKGPVLAVVEGQDDE